MADAVLEPRGPFTLASAARFIGGWEAANRTRGGEAAPGSDAAEVRLGFLVDDWSGHAGVLLRQAEPHGPVEATLTARGAAQPERAIAQAARVVSLDHDGRDWGELGRRDPVIGALQEDSGFLRPVLFHSPYEAACWATISARVQHAQAARVRDALAAEHGATLAVAGEELPGFPAPERLLAVDAFPGLPAEKVRRLHGIAHAALEGRLDRDRLLAAGHEAGVAALQELRGIGPFWADLIYLRAVGPTDALALGEPRGRRRVAERYGHPELAEDDEAFRALAERWRPWRTWCSVLLRATG
jgi:DNA-3-methyladenine glycosylase II